MIYLATDPYEAQEADAAAFESKIRTIAEHLLHFEFTAIEDKAGHCFVEWILEEGTDGGKDIDLMRNQLLSMIKRSSDWHTHVPELAADFLEDLES